MPSRWAAGPFSLPLPLPATCLPVYHLACLCANSDEGVKSVGQSVESRNTEDGAHSPARAEILV